MNVAETRREATAACPPGMLFVPGGTFRMGSDDHYKEEAPAHRVKVDGFFIDRTPVTNRQFKAFVKAAGYVTMAERVPDAKRPIQCDCGYPGQVQAPTGPFVAEKWRR